MSNIAYERARAARAAKAKGLKFYEASHRYKLDGAWVPGVTTILGVLNKPALTKWAAREVAEYVADHREAVEHLYHLIGPDLRRDYERGLPRITVRIEDLP